MNKAILYTQEKHTHTEGCHTCVCVSVSGIALQINICIHYRVIHTTSLVTIHHHRVSLYPFCYLQPPSPLVTTNLFSVSMSLLYIICSFVLFDSTYEWNHTVFVFLYLTGWGLFVCLPVCWFVFPLHPFCCWTLYSAFFSSVMFFAWYLIIFSISLLKFSFICSSPVIAEHLYGITLNSLSDGLFFHIIKASFLGFVIFLHLLILSDSVNLSICIR